MSIQCFEGDGVRQGADAAECIANAIQQYRLVRATHQDHPGFKNLMDKLEKLLRETTTKTDLIETLNRGLHDLDRWIARRQWDDLAVESLAIYVRSCLDTAYPEIAGEPYVTRAVDDPTPVPGWECLGWHAGPHQWAGDYITPIYRCAGVDAVLGILKGVVGPHITESRWEVIETRIRSFQFRCMDAVSDTVMEGYAELAEIVRCPDKKFAPYGASLVWHRPDKRPKKGWFHHSGVPRSHLDDDGDWTGA